MKKLLYITQKLICRNKSERTTVLLGAGAALELSPDGSEWPTTENITRSIVDEYPKGYDTETHKAYDITLLEDIYKHLCSNYSPAPLDANAEGSASKVHFEIIFHILEMLETYSRSWRPTANQKHKAPFAPFISLDNFQCNENDFFMASRHLLSKIYDMVYSYDSHFIADGNDWYRSFWSGRKNSWDVFNLNYDTTIEQSLVDYEDGFEFLPEEPHFMRFNANRLIKNKAELSTVNHIHGCISFGPDRYADINHDAYDYEHHDMYKWPTVEEAHERWLGQTSGNYEAQNGQTVIQGPIITGLSKTEKTTCLPYDIYRQNLYNSIKKNNSLLIAGYSFGDKYINHIFYRMSQMHGNNKRIVLIDYWNIGGYIRELNDDEDSVYDDNNIHPRIFESYFYEEFSNGEELMFIKRVAHHDTDVWEHFDHLSSTEPMVSDNGQLMLLIGGMKHSLENYTNEIYKFLNS